MTPPTPTIDVDSIKTTQATMRLRVLVEIDRINQSIETLQQAHVDVANGEIEWRNVEKVYVYR